MWKVTKSKDDPNSCWLVDRQAPGRYNVDNPRYCWPVGDDTFLDLGTAITLCDQFNMRDYGRLGDDDVVSG